MGCQQPSTLCKIQASQAKRKKKIVGSSCLKFLSSGKKTIENYLESLKVKRFNHFRSLDSKCFSMETEADLLLLLRQIGSVKRKRMSLQETRAHLVAEDISVVPIESATVI